MKLNQLHEMDNYSRNLSMFVYYIRNNSSSEARDWQQLVLQNQDDSSMRALLNSGATIAEIINDLQLYDAQFKEVVIYIDNNVLDVLPAPSCSIDERLNQKLQ